MCLLARFQSLTTSSPDKFQSLFPSMTRHIRNSSSRMDSLPRRAARNNTESNLPPSVGDCSTNCRAAARTLRCEKVATAPTNMWQPKGLMLPHVSAEYAPIGRGSGAPPVHSRQVPTNHTMYGYGRGLLIVEAGSPTLFTGRAPCTKRPHWRANSRRGGGQPSKLPRPLTPFFLFLTAPRAVSSNSPRACAPHQNTYTIYFVTYLPLHQLSKPSATRPAGRRYLIPPQAPPTRNQTPNHYRKPPSVAGAVLRDETAG